MVFQVTDDSGFLAIIDPDAYRGFVHADWTWGTIHEHFRREMRDRHLLIWALAWSTAGASTFRFSRPEPQASARWWAASTLRGVACSSPTMRASRWRRSSPMSRCRRHTSEGRSCLCHPVSTTAALFSCQTRKVVHPSRSRSVLSMSLRELHHRERFGASFPGARTSHAPRRIRRNTLSHQPTATGDARMKRTMQVAL